MSSSRDLRLQTRIENTRESIPSQEVSEFTFDDILTRFYDNIALIETQFEIYTALEQQGKEIEGKNILRSQIVFLESALDFFLHEITKIAMINMLSGVWAKTERYKNYKIPMSCVEIAIEDNESTKWFLEHVNQAFSRSVFIGFEEFKDQVNMLGFDCNEVLRIAFQHHGTPNQAYLAGKAFLIELFKRRNQIAHQTDREHRTAQMADISKEYVIDCITNVKNIIQALQHIAQQK